MEYSQNNKEKQCSASNATDKTIQNKAVALQDNRPASILQRKENNTGLPDNLKSGIENLSGHAMDDVKVHYNSDKPAQLNAHAYAQGTDIHVASGQEKHLAHEAWHVVQQKQGRVKPTLQMKGKVNVNDDKGLENEADVMGAKALQLKQTMPSEKKIKKGLRKSNTTIQKKIKNVSGVSEKTPVGAITDVLKVAGKELNLPGVQPVGNQFKAVEAQAEVKKNTLRATERKKNGNLSKITSMARAEQLLLQGADIKKFYDAGHLVADQLVGGKDDSFEMWNLAPQIAEFNAPAYAQTMEEETKKVAQAGGTVTVNVKVGYDSPTYPVTVKHILDQEIISGTPIGTTHIKIGSKIHLIAILNEVINIPRRIPVTWNMKATSQGGAGFPKATIPSGPGEAANRVIDPATIDTITPNIGNKFAFGISDSSNDTKNLTLNPNKERTLVAKQWAPSLHGIQTEDVVSWISSTFPELGNADAIIVALSEDKSILQLLQAAHHTVEKKLTITIEKLQKVLDPSLLDDLIVSKLNIIKPLLEKANDLARAKNLREAVQKLVNADSAVDDLNAGIEDAIAEQGGMFLFPLHVLLKMQQDAEEFNTAKEIAPELRSLVNAKKFFTGQQYGIKGKNDKGGAFEFFYFGAPCMIEEPINVGPPMENISTVVIASNVIMVRPGVWEITYRYPGA
ncbi:DUF4157 domain-containing protein [Flavobacterium sp. N1736]|uniref:eCIS core domain-containing protein n=1 Tax=Flavobacterium sp. N1736 TaxID=2986823 RepID=UPI00222535F9|nr:DUF4157 domain-containing protein [Flavobacterium sp. N1736]